MKKTRLILYGWLWLAAAWVMQTAAVAAPADTASNVRLLGQIGGLIGVVTVADNKAYIREGRSVTIVDVAQPATPTVLGRIQPLPAAIKDIVIQNNYAYVVAGTAGLHIFDVANPAKVLRVGFYDTPGEAVGLALAGNYLYIADSAEGLRVIDVSNPAALHEVGSYKPTGNTEVAYIADGYAYVVAGGNLWIVSITDPTKPAQVGFFDPAGYAHDVRVVGNRAYLADGGNGVRILDVSDRTKPSEIRFYELRPEDGFNVTKVVVAGNYAYLLDYDKGLDVIDLNSSTSPPAVGRYGADWSEDLYVAGRYAYVVNGSYLKVVDVSNPLDPSEVGSYSTPQGAEDVAVQGNYAYVTDGFSGIYVVDITKPTAAKTVGFYELAGSAVRIFVTGKYAYVGNYDNGLSIIDISNPTAPTEAGFYQGGPSLQRVFVAGNYAYMPDGGVGLEIANVSNPAAVSRVASYDTPGSAETVYVNGNYAYVADGGSGLRILNVTNPASPTNVGFFDTPGYASSVAVNGDYAYVADGLSGLRVVRISNPATPSEAGALDTVGDANDVAVSGNLAYVADGDGGLRVIDVTNPAAPVERGSYVLPEYAGNLSVAGNVAYLSSGDGLSILRYPDCYRLTFAYSGAGAIPAGNPVNSPGCPPNEYVPQAFVTLSAGPAPGWRVASWNGTSNDSAIALNNTVTMPAADHEVRVNYGPVCYSLTLTHTGTGNNPSASPPSSSGCAAGQYMAGQVITLTAAPGVGNTVGGWSGTGNDSSPATSNTLTMPATAHTAGASYVLACYPLTLAHTGSGGDPAATPGQSAGCPAGAYHFEETVTLSASPASGWQVSAWSGTTNNSLSSASNTLLMPAANHTAIVHYGETPTAAPGDLYELDNSCTRSRTLATDGSEVQDHSFHAAADVDWVRFDAVANTLYRIDVTVPSTSTADVVMEVYRDCASAPLDQWTGGFSPGARLEISRTVSGPTYVRLSNDNANAAGNQVRYNVSVRKMGEAPTNRLLIIVAGRLKLNDRVQANIDKVASNVYNLFQRNGYNDANIQLLASNANLPGYDGAASKASVQAAIQQAASRVTNGVLTLYLVDHGSPELFYIDGVTDQTVTPSELNDWLTQLESAAPGVKINVIIEACESGSFIDKPGTISKPGRVVLTSSNADNDAKASKEGAYFSDHLLTWLQQGFNLSASFLEARTAAKSAYSLQEAWLDSNGNGLANEFDDSALAAQRSFAYAGTLADSEWPPHIFAAATIGPVSDQKVRLRVDARDNGGVRQVWAVLYEPDYTPPPSTQVLQPEVLPTFLLTRVDNDNHWEAEVTGLTQAGNYRLVIQSDDEQGLVARPVVIEVNTGGRLYLPMVER